MNEILKFANDSPWLTFFLAYLAFPILVWPFRLVNRWIRHLNIKAQGWPPVHLDGDGDVVKRED